MNELVLLSLIVTLIFTELTNLLPGGIVVPFYFALYADDPMKMAATVITAILSLLIIRLLSNVAILYGRRKFALYIVVGLLLKLLFTYAYFGNSYMFHNLSMTIGYLVPGILGRQMERQGIWRTLAALAIVTLLIKLIQVLL